MKLPAKHSNYVNKAGKHKKKKGDVGESQLVVRRHFNPVRTYTHLCRKFGKLRQLRNNGHLVEWTKTKPLNGAISELPRRNK
jgi:hypothetical protein